MKLFTSTLFYCLLPFVQGYVLRMTTLLQVKMLISVNIVGRKNNCSGKKGKQILNWIPQKLDEPPTITPLLLFMMLMSPLK